MSNAKEMPDELLEKGNEKETHIKAKAGSKDMPKNPNKRVHDKHSGTGRGKEIAKNGGGGKFTWGTNEKALQQEANLEDEYPVDDGNQD